MNRLVLLPALLLFLGLGHSALFASEQPPSPPPPPTPGETTHIVFVPYDRMSGPEWGAGESVLLPYAKFLELQGSSGPEKLPPPDPVASISDLSLSGVLHESLAVIDGVLTLRVLAEEEQSLTVPLPFEGVSLESLRVEGGDAMAAPDDRSGVLLTLKGGGDRTLHVRFAVHVASGANRRIEFGIPRAAATSLRLTSAEAVELVERARDVPAVVVPLAPKGSTITAAAGGLDRIGLTWRPAAVESAAAVEARLAATSTYAVTIGPDGYEVRASFEVEVLASQIGALTVKVPEGMRVLSVSGAQVRDWTAAEGAATAQVRLVEEVSGKFSLQLEAQATATEAGEFSIAVPSIEGTVRDAGSVTVSPGNGLELWPGKTRGLQAAPGSSHARGARTWSFSATGWELWLSREALKPVLRADGLIVYDVTNELVRLRTHHSVSVGGVGIFGTGFTVPEGYELLEAGPPDLVSGWRQNGRSVELNFRTEVLTQFDVTLRLQRPRASVEEDVALLPVSLDAAEEDSGSVVLAAPPALRPTEARAEGLQPTDVRTMLQRLRGMHAGDAVPVLGYRYIAPEFSGLVKMERQRTRLTCETAILASFSPSLLTVQAWLDWNVEYSATDEFQLLVPESVGDDVRIDGADIKEKSRVQAAREDGMTAWVVRLQRRVLGPYRLTLSYDVPLDAGEDGKPLDVALPLVRSLNSARETGSVAISRGENLEIRVATSDGLERRDVKELPASLASAFLGFRYFDPAATKLELELVRHDLEPVLGAVIRRLHIETVVSDQREALHEVWFDVQNNREQYLELQLPAAMSVWSVFVSGRPVRPALRESDSTHLIELTKSPDAASAFRVRAILRETLPGGELGWRGRLTFTPPAVRNMPVLRSTWKTYLPKGWKYTDFGGDMKLASGGATPWLEPVAELWLAEAPAAFAGGVAANLRNPGATSESPFYEANETDAERQARAGAGALDIPIVKEGVQFEFSRLSGIGTVEISYWSRKVLLAMQGMLALLLFGALVGVWMRGGHLAVPLAAVLTAFAAASLFEGLAGRLAATGLAASTAALVLTVGLTVLRRGRDALEEQRAKNVEQQSAREAELQHFVILSEREEAPSDPVEEAPEPENRADEPPPPAEDEQPKDAK